MPENNNNGGKHTIEEVLAMHAAQEEKNNQTSQGAVSPADRVNKNAPKNVETEPVEEEVSAFDEQQVSRKKTLKEAQAERREEIRQEQKEIGLGFIPIPVKDLPTGGLFLPEGSQIYIRSASMGEIRAWSLMDETELQEIDDAINHVIERCCSISSPGKTANYKDLNSVDRLYILISIHDLTYTDGHNELKIAVNETDDVIVKKDNIKFVDFPQKLLDNYYNADKRCFSFKARTPNAKDLNIYMPSIGTTMWIKSYAQRKGQLQEAFDGDFAKIAPMLIQDWRSLTDEAYVSLLAESHRWGSYEWSIISRMRTILTRAVSPVMSYTTEDGKEAETPLNFRGGIKAIIGERIDELDF